MDLGLDGKVVVITGGSSGIGRAAAQLFAEEGCNVAIAARSEAPLKEAARAISDSTGSKVIPVVCDIRRADQIAHLMSTTRESFGGVDVLVNNAGAPVPKPYEEMTQDDWQEVLSYKLLGYINCAVAALPYMRERGGGRIINISGTAGREPNPWTTGTGIVNAGLGNFTKTLSSQVAKDGILVNAVSPGPIATNRWTSLSRSTADATAAIVSCIPLGRLGKPEEVAAIIVFLASNRATFVTGVSVTVDGGRNAGVVF